MLRKAVNPTTSVMVVSNMPDECAGSKPSFFMVKGMSAPLRPAAIRFTTMAAPSVASRATLLSTPSCSQAMPRRTSWIHCRAERGEARIDRSTRPAPMGLCRHAAVGQAQPRPVCAEEAGGRGR